MSLDAERVVWETRHALVTPTVRLVWLAFVHASRDQAAIPTPGLRELVALTGLSEHTILRSLDALVRAKLLGRNRGRRRV